MSRECDIQLTHNFQFTRNWFRTRNLPTFRTQVLPVWAGRPLRYLEIGVFEAQSMVWMMQNVVTHPASRAVGIDPWLLTTKLDAEFMELVGQRAMHNTEPFRERCQLIRGSSAEVLRRMLHRGGFAGISKDSVDICMIDGDHNRLAVLDDARLCVQLVKTGGWILFDDVENDHKKENHVRHGVDDYLAESKDLKLIWKHRYVECYEKVSID